MAVQGTWNRSAFGPLQKEEKKSEAAQQRHVAMKVTKERAPGKLRMQDLRDMNQVELMQEDKDKRYKDANEPKRVRALLRRCDGCNGTLTKFCTDGGALVKQQQATRCTPGNS